MRICCCQQQQQQHGEQEDRCRIVCGGWYCAKRIGGTRALLATRLNLYVVVYMGLLSRRRISSPPLIHYWLAWYALASYWCVCIYIYLSSTSHKKLPQVDNVQLCMAGINISSVWINKYIKKIQNNIYSTFVVVGMGVSFSFSFFIIYLLCRK